MRRWFAAAIAAVVWLGCGGLARAEDYPARSITMNVSFPAGGATATLARLPWAANKKVE